MISLKDCIKDTLNFEEAMDMLNFEGQKHGLRFKKGNIQYDKEGNEKFKYIFCCYKPRNKIIKTKN